MTLTDLADAYVGQRLSVIGEFYGDFDTQFRKLRAQINDEINPLLIQHGADPLPLDRVPNPDQADD